MTSDRYDSPLAPDRPLVLVHGFLGSPADWDPLLRECNRESGGVRGECIVVDLLDVARRADATSGLVGLAKRIIEDLGRDKRTSRGFDLLGYSLGGRIALEIALLSSEFVGSRNAHPARLILASTHLGIDDSSERATRRATDDRLAERLAMLGDITDADSRRRFAESFLDDWYRQGLFATLHGQDGFAILAHRRRDELAAVGAGSIWSSIVSSCSPGRATPHWERLETLASSCLLIVGERDARYIAVANRARAMGVRTEVVLDTGHAVHLEHPPRVARIVNQFRFEQDRSPLRDIRSRERAPL